MKSSMAGAGGERKELLALMHQHLVQIGYGKAAKELLRQSGQKNFPSPSVPLEDIFIQWKKGSIRAQKRKADDTKTDAAAKIRIPDPKSSSETSEEEEEAIPIKTNVPGNKSSSAKAESSSEEEDSSSEEEAAAGKVVKATVTGNQTANFLQLAAQKTNSVPGKGVAVAAVQAKEKPSKAISNKPSPLATAKAGQNKVPSGKPGAALPSQPPPGLSTAPAGMTQKAADSESSSSTSESEEEKKSSAVKMAAPKTPLKKAESSSEDSSEDSDSEEEPTNAAKVQVKPAVQSAQISATPAKSLSITAIPSKESTVKAYPAKTKVSQIKAATGIATESKKPADSSDTSDSSDSEDEEPSSVAQAKSSEKTPQASTASVKNILPNRLSDKAASTPTPLKQPPKPVSILTKPALQTLAKVAGNAESSESSESSSESEDEVPPVPVSQKRLRTPQPPTGVKQNQAAKPGTPVKAPSSALKRKETVSESSSSSDSEDETVPTAQNLASPSGTKTNAAAQLSHAKKPFSPPTPLKAAQQSEDSSQDSSDESDSEEDTVFTQKPSPVTQKALVTPVRAVAAKTTGATLGKAGSAQSAGKGKANIENLATASLQKASQSSETDDSDSSESEEDGKPAAQPPIHPFFKQKVPSSKAATPSGKGVQVNTVTDSVSNKCHGKILATTQGKMDPSTSKNAKPGQSQTLLAKPAGILQHETSGSSSSSGSEEEAAAPLATSTQISQPAGISQKQEVTKKADSSSEESSDEEQESSQSLLAGHPGLFKTPTAIVQKSVTPKPSKQGSGKTASTTGTPAFNALAKSSEKMGSADVSSSDSSNSDSDAEETPGGPKAVPGVLPLSAKKAVVAKVSKVGPDSAVSQASPAKKATAKSQRNGRAKGNAAIQLTLIPHPESGDNKAVAQDPGAGAQGDTEATPVVAVKTPKTVKPSKSGVKEKQKKKRKLAAGDAGLGEPKKKKQKGQTDSKKKKKSKSSSSTKAPKEKDSKEKKSKKRKSKMLASATSDGLPLLKKKKKKKKKTNDLEGAV